MEQEDQEEEEDYTDPSSEAERGGRDVIVGAGGREVEIEGERLPERGSEDAVLVLNDGGRRVTIAMAIVERRDNRVNYGFARVESGGGRNPRPAEGLDRAAHAAGGGPVHLDLIELGEPMSLVERNLRVRVVRVGVRERKIGLRLGPTEGSGRSVVCPCCILG